MLGDMARGEWRGAPSNAQFRDAFLGAGDAGLLQERLGGLSPGELRQHLTFVNCLGMRDPDTDLMMCACVTVRVCVCACESS